METTMADVLDRADELETTEYIEQAEQRARRFSGAYTGTSGTLAADCLRLIARIRELEAMEPPQERIYDSVSRPCPVDGPVTTSKFGTGAVRSDTVEEFRYDLVSPIGLREVARACAEGAEKYGDWNWEKGMPVHDLLNHAIAHLYQFLSGDRSEPHLGHAAWNVLAAIHSEQLWPHLNAGTLRAPGCAPPDSALRMPA